VTSDVNTIRTVLPKSIREAAHSPPRHQTKSSMSETNKISPSKIINPIPTIVTVDCTSPPINTEKTNPKMIKEGSSLKYSQRNSDGIIMNSSSDPTTSEEIHSTSVLRRFYEHFSSRIKNKKFYFRCH